MACRVIVCGSRGWEDRQRVADRIKTLPSDAVVVHGGAKGPDRMAAQAASERGLTVEPHKANWERYGKRAGLIRNHQMAELGADLCIAFWDGKSNGTRHMMEQAIKQGIPVELIE